MVKCMYEMAKGRVYSFWAVDCMRAYHLALRRKNSSMYDMRNNSNSEVLRLQLNSYLRPFRGNAESSNKIRALSLRGRAEQLDILASAFFMRFLRTVVDRLQRSCFLPPFPGLRLGLCILIWIPTIAFSSGATNIDSSSAIGRSDRVLLAELLQFR